MRKNRIYAVCGNESPIDSFFKKEVGNFLKFEVVLPHSLEKPLSLLPKSIHQEYVGHCKGTCFDLSTQTLVSYRPWLEYACSESLCII